MPVTNPWKAKAQEEKEAQQQPPPAQTTSKSTTKKFGGKTPEPETQKNDEPAQSRRSKFVKNDEKQNQSINRSVEKESDNEDDQQAGRIRNLAGFFASQKDDPKNVKKKRFEIDDEPETLILENEPERLEGVVRADDPGEWDKPIELEKGWAKNMASMFQNKQQDDAHVSKKPFTMDIDRNAETLVLENEPVRLEGVVRCADKTEDVIGKRGRIKNIAGKFANPSTNEDEEDGASGRKNPVEIGRNIAGRWKQQQEESTSSGEGTQSKPKWMIELESATDYGVYENEPEVRNDVVRADDEQPDVISAQHTRNLRKMWSQIEKEEMTKEKEPKRSDILVRPKKKEPSPEPEPPPPPVEEPKPRRYGGTGGVRANVGAFGAVYGKLAKKEKTPPPPPPEPEPPKRGARNAAHQQAAAAPVDVKDSKMLLKPTLKSVPKKKF